MSVVHGWLLVPALRPDWCQEGGDETGAEHTEPDTLAGGKACVPRGEATAHCAMPSPMHL